MTHSLTENSYDFDPNDYPLPEWAAKRWEGEYELATQLCTRDGRRMGNAFLYDIETKEFEGVPYVLYHILTDMGSLIRMTENELKEVFHEPTYVGRIDAVRSRIPITCCNRGRSTRGWHHNEDCPEYVFVD
jgi:hypothetical protein